MHRQEGHFHPTGFRRNKGVAADLAVARRCRESPQGEGRRGSFGNDGGGRATPADKGNLIDGARTANNYELNLILPRDERFYPYLRP